MDEIQQPRRLFQKPIKQMSNGTATFRPGTSLRGMGIILKRTVGAVAIALVVVAAHADAATVGYAANTKCPPSHAHLLRSDKQAVVYKIRESGIETLEKEHYRVYYPGIRGCVRGRRLSYKLGGPSTEFGDASGESSSGIDSITLGGSMVAYEEEITGSERYGENASGKWIVWVRDLRTGKVIHKVPTGTRIPSDPSFIGVGPTTAIAVKSDGAVAWIAEAEDGYQVHVLDKTGNRLLASGENIKPYVLGLKGSRLYWKQAGHVRSAVLN
jgi:hypothetical protein